MKNSYLFILDQLLFSLANFLVFMAIDKKFHALDVASFAILMSTSALLSQLGFAIFLEKHVSKKNRGVSVQETVLLFTLLLCFSAVLFFLFFSKNNNNDILLIMTTLYPFLWTCKKMLILLPDKIRISIAINCGFLFASLLTIISATSYRTFLYLQLILILITCAITLLNCKLNVNVGFSDFFKEVFSNKKEFLYSLYLVPLFWFPSNGIYIILSFFGSSITLIEARKLLMLISPVQQISAALINSIFAQVKISEHKNKKYLFVYPWYVALIASSSICLVYHYAINGNFSFLLWVALTLMTFSMLSASYTQAKLRVSGRQKLVSLVYFIASLVKIILFLGFYGMHREMDIVTAVSIMTIAYLTIMFIFTKVNME